MPNITDITRVNAKLVSATVDGISFGSIPKSTKVIPQPQPTGRQYNPWNENSEGSWASAVNAVDIDWNAANLSNIGTQAVSMPTTINSSGDLLMTIKYLVSENNKLQATVAALVEEALVVNDNNEDVVATTTTQAP